MPPGALATRLHANKSAISRQTRQLQRFGLIQTGTDAADRRTRIVRLTPLARERLSMLGPGGCIRAESPLSGWDTADLTHFAGYLGRLLDEVD